MNWRKKWRFIKNKERWEKEAEDREWRRAEKKANRHEWWGENLRIIISIITFLVLAGSIYSYSLRADNQLTDNKPKETTEKVMYVYATEITRIKSLGYSDPYISIWYSGLSEKVMINFSSTKENDGETINIEKRFSTEKELYDYLQAIN